MHLVQSETANNHLQQQIRTHNDDLNITKLNLSKQEKTLVHTDQDLMALLD